MLHSSVRRQSRLHFTPQIMNGKGVYVGKTQRPHVRFCYKGKPLSSCNKKGRANKVVVIDVDCDDYINDVFVDVPEFNRGSGCNGKRKDRNYSFATVICIDDDDEADREEIVGDNYSGKSRFFGGNSNSTPVKLTKKCKRTYSGKASTSNRCGLGIDTEIVSSDDDFELEGSSGMIKKDWEKAFLRRKNGVFSSVNEAGTSRFCSDSHQDIGTGDKKNRDGSGLGFTNHEEVDRSPSDPMDDGKSENIFCNNGCETSTFDRVNSVCNDQSFASDPGGTSHVCIDDQHIGIDMKNNEYGSLVVMDDVAKGQSSRDKNNDCVFFNREMHKETDEYKCSVEAELEARQRELQIQAEVAQHQKRLMKREKAEAMRLLDMERRQKLRVEEMRKTQKKDQENLNLKEKLRAEVREHLDKLEAACHDMASILRGLGINVNGINGVHTAFKRALLTFHPDRSSQSDIRQQVEAEEKFKLVTRMKEKYLSTKKKHY